MSGFALISFLSLEKGKLYSWEAQEITGITGTTKTTTKNEQTCSKHRGFYLDGEFTDHLLHTHVEMAQVWRSAVTYTENQPH